MIARIKTEFIIYGMLLIILTLAMHPDILSNPLARFDIMQSRANFAHPFLYTTIAYIAILAIRIIGSLVMKIFKKN